MITITVHGTPAPQGSKRHVGRGVMVESSKRLGPWRDAVRADAIYATELFGEWPAPLDGPLLVDMVFTFARPRSHYRSGRNAHLLGARAPRFPVGPPDLSKLARATEDALTDAGIWVDDSRVVAYGRLAKVYPGDDPDALDTPGVVIRVTPLTDVIPFPRTA
jgi:Holliday junction resolvase RusA-like endonuclease